MEIKEMKERKLDNGDRSMCCWLAVIKESATSYRNVLPHFLGYNTIFFLFFRLVLVGLLGLGVG
jgi:hypothetical protein